MPGPAPYTQGPDDVVACANTACGVLNDRQAVYCRRCGTTMPGTPSPYMRGPEDTVLCASCRDRYVSPDSQVCQFCGSPMPNAAFLSDTGAYGSEWGTPSWALPPSTVSNSGRRPDMQFYESPGDVITRLGRAERTQAITQDDEDTAADELREVLVDAAPGAAVAEEYRFSRGRDLDSAVADFSETSRHRAGFGADARHRFIVVMNAADRWRAAVDANTRAKRDVSRLLEEFQAISTPGMGLLPPGLGDLDDDQDRDLFWNGLGPSDRSDRW